MRGVWNVREMRLVMGALAGYLAYGLAITLADAAGFVGRASYGWSTRLVEWWLFLPLSTLAFTIQGEWEELGSWLTVYLVLVGIGAFTGLAWPSARNPALANPLLKGLWKAARVGICALAAALAVQSWTAFSEQKRIRIELGAPPGRNVLGFTLDRIKEGMSRREVETVAWFYSRSGDTNLPGEIETRYYFRFGVFKMICFWPNHGVILVSYDTDGRVLGAMFE